MSPDCGSIATDLARLRAALFEASEDAIILRGADGSVIDWNAAAERLFGWTAAEMIGAQAKRLVPDGHDDDASVRERILAGEEVGQFLARRQIKNGASLDVVMTVSPIRDDGGAVVAFGEIVRSASNYLEQQRRLAESEQHFRMLADNISQLAWIARGDGHIFWYNQRWYEYTGTTLEEMQGWGWQKVHHPDHVEQVSEHFRASVLRGDEWEDTFPLLSREGEWRWFLSRAKPIRASDATGDGEVEYWFGTNTDITEEREQAEQIRLLLMEVNHRSKNLLGTVQALARRTAPDDPTFLARFEDRIHSLAVNQDILVRREWRQVPVRELAEAQLAFLVDAPGEFTLTGPDLPLLPRAAETLGMALHELATNALKYGALSIDGGHVDIGWSAQPREEGGRFEIWWRESGGPDVVDTKRQGFGTRLIRDVPRHNLGADVTLNFPAGGVCWEVKCALDAVSRPPGTSA